MAYLSRVAVARPPTEYVSLDGALGRVLAEPIVADHDYPNADRSVMDGFALRAEATPGRFVLVDAVAMGIAPARALGARGASPIPTGGVLPEGADAVVPVEDARRDGDAIVVEAPLKKGENIAERAADMRRGQPVLATGRRIRPQEIGVLATLGVTKVPVYRLPVLGVFSSGDELVEPSARPAAAQIRDSNRYAVAGALRAMGATPRHYPTLRDEATAFETALSSALDECDGVVISGGSSVGERDRLPRAVAKIAEPGIIVHGLRVKPGKPTLLGARGPKPIVGLPGNPTSALMMLEAVASPIIAALAGAPVLASTVQARLAQPLRSRRGWTWYIPVRLRDDGGVPLAHPLALRSFSVSLLAAADGYVVMDERDEEWPAQTSVTVTRFLGSA